MKKKQDPGKIIITKEQRVIALYDGGITNCASIWRRIKNTTKCSLRNVQQIVKKYKEGKQITRKTRSDKGSSKLSPYSKKIKKYIDKSSYADSSFIKKKFNLEQSRRTIREFIQKNDIAQFKGYKKSFYLTQKQKQDRINFAQKHLKDNMQLAIFDDEASFQLFCYPQKTYQLKDNRKVGFKTKHPPKINAWGAISLRFKSELYIFTETIDGDLYRSILKKNLFKEIPNYFKNEKPNLYSDKDPKHTAKSTLSLIEKQQINRIIDWPANSPDLNPIENVWGIIKMNVQKKFPQTIAQLKKFIKNEWNSLPQSTIDKLINSWEERLKQIAKSQGEKIDY